MPKAMWETEDQAQHNAVVGGRKSNTDKYVSAEGGRDVRNALKVPGR